MADGELEVPDPYYGAAGGFEEVFGLVSAACGGLLAEIRADASRDPSPGAAVQAVGGGLHQRGLPGHALGGRQAMAFVKTRAEPDPASTQPRRAGLRWLAEPQALQTPEVLELGEGYLALEWIEPGRLERAGAEDSAGASPARISPGPQQFGDPARESRARRRASARCGCQRAGRGLAGVLCSGGSLPLARIGRGQRTLLGGPAPAVERVCERIVELAGPAEPPARLHGDLWRAT